MTATRNSIPLKPTFVVLVVEEYWTMDDYQTVIRFVKAVITVKAK